MRKVLLCLMLAASVSLSAQETVVLTLDQCIEAALENNLQIKRAKNNELIARSNHVQSLMQFLPSINGAVDYAFRFGAFFDQTAASVVDQQQSSGPFVAASWNVFNGFQNMNVRKQRQQELIAAQANVNATDLATRANILQLYLNVVIGMENVKIGQQRVELLTAQLSRSEKRESVGVSSLEEVYNFRSQLANEKLGLQTQQNTLERNKLLLLQAMLLDPQEANFEFETIELADEIILEEPEAFSVILSETLQQNPQLRSAEASLGASRSQFKAAQAGYLPSIVVSGSISSRYSSNGAFNPDELRFDDDGNPAGFVFEADATYLEQMGYNLGERVGITLNIPIFNRFQTKNSVQIAKVGLLNSELALSQARVDVTNIVQQVHLDLITAQATYESASENLESLQQSFEFMEKRYQTGNSDFYTYLESLNNKNRAEVQLANAKYSIVLRKRILELYRGQ